MNIQYPPKLQYFLDDRAEDSMSLNFQVNPPRAINAKFPNQPLPGKFGHYHSASSFVINYYQELFTYAIIFMLLFIAIALNPLTKRIKYVGTIFTKMRGAIQWNLFLIVILSNMDSVGVFSSLEFRTTPFNSFSSVLGTLICVIINLLAIFLMGLTLHITYSSWRSRETVFPESIRKQKTMPEKRKEVLKNEEEKYMNCGVLYLNFKEDSLIQRSCMFFILLRVYLFNMVIGYLFEHPLAQSILIVLMSFVMLVYLSVQRPYRNSFELIKAIT
ncbi:MAG: hypothetical protein EOO43_26060, partial [Flavobacterium sp.]